MTKKIRILTETPGDIGDFTDNTSLASMLLNNIDKVSSKIAFLAVAFDSISKEDIEIDPYELDGLKAICEDMNDDLITAHEIICSPEAYQKKAPVTEPSQKDSSGA